MANYKVKQGDYLSKIAKQHGLADYLTIWDHPENAKLKEKRQNPNVLYPGDVIFIPEKEGKTDSGETEQKHRFKTKGKTLMLRIVFRDFNDRPVKNTECDLLIDGKVYSLTTDSDGMIKQRIPATAEVGMIIFKDPQVPFDQIPIKIGHLDPIEEITGWQARLNNLGYNAGTLDYPDEEQIRMAVGRFQADHGLEVDGICGEKTQKKLREVYGC